MARIDDKTEPLQVDKDLGGMFYPVGYILVAFPDERQARRIRDELHEGGWNDESCRFYSAQALAKIARTTLEHNTGWLARLGKSRQTVQLALEEAEKGAAFLLIRASNDDEAQRAMNAVRGGPFKFAHRYHELAIEIIE